MFTGSVRGLSLPCGKPANVLARYIYNHARYFALIIICVTISLMTIIPAYWQTVAKGSVLVIAVVLNRMLVSDTVTT